MSASFEAEKNKKALGYTVVICGIMLILAIFVTWQLPKPPVPIVEDLIEINLGNEVEGSGDVQPLIKGEKSPGEQQPEEQQLLAAKPEPVKDILPDEVEDKDAAPVNKPEKVKPVIKPVAAPVVAPAPKPQKPKIAGYQSPTPGKGNGANEDNGYTYQGNNPGGKGDAGSVNGKPDSYGNNPGGKSGGALRVSKGDRTIVNNYIFMGDLPKATINAVIKVSPEGRGIFVTFDKGSTSNDPAYVSAIRNYLPNIQFNKADHESIVTVPFNFRVQ
ncbi:MAG: hypothetical protein IPP31_13850 [Chitinophagaceae bacterium]|nr:hypothetical protein [Chitinophagaceae bacterium]